MAALPLLLVLLAVSTVAAMQFASTQFAQSHLKVSNTVARRFPMRASLTSMSDARDQRATVELPPWTSVVTAKVVAIEPAAWCSAQGACYQGYQLRIAVERRISGNAFSEKELFQRATNASDYGSSDFKQIIGQSRLWKIRSLGESLELAPLVSRPYTPKDLSVFADLKAGTISFNQAFSYFEAEDTRCQISQFNED